MHQLFPAPRRRLDSNVLLLSAALCLPVFASAQTAAPQVSSDATNLYYKIPYSGTPSWVRVYLDTDSNAATGYRFGSIGASYLIENGKLFRYTGSGGTNWSWALVKSVSYSLGSGSASLTVARSDLGSPTGINLITQTDPPTQTSATITQTLSAAAPQATSDATNVYYKIPYSGTPSWVRVYLDTDRNAATGYSVAGIGAAYLVENGTLYRYTGSGGSNWGWSAVKQVGYSVGNGVANVTIARSDLGSPSGINLITQTDPPTQTSATIAQTLASGTTSSTSSTTSPTGSTSTTSPSTTTTSPSTSTSTTSPSTSTTSPTTSTTTPTTSLPAPTSVSYTASTATIANPERGFYHPLDCSSAALNQSTLQGYRTSQNDTLVHCYFNLSGYVSSAIGQSALDMFQNNMNIIRNAGLKTVLRFTYNMSDNAVDPTQTQLNAHLDQLAPYLEKNKDVIAVVQAGFIGSWGEWANSQHFGAMPNLSTQNWTDRQSFTTKLLQTVPAERMVQLRMPIFKQRMTGSTTPLASSEAFTGSAKARLGHHNDCFLASSTDYGTYTDASTEYPYLAADTAYTPMGGETCNYAPPRSDCPTALSEMAKFHWSYLNMGYNQTVLNAWQSQGCYSQVQQKLGYRFVLQNGAYSSSAKPGGAFQVNLTLQNQGWAAPYNSRDVELVLRNTATGALYRFKLNTDPRLWLPGQNVTVSQTLTLPADMVKGNYAVLLNLPDPMTSLRARPEYAIQLANANTWEASTGFNNLNFTTSIAP
jgi:hypothetical protein